MFKSVAGALFAVLLIVIALANSTVDGVSDLVKRARAQAQTRTHSRQTVREISRTIWSSRITSWVAQKTCSRHFLCRTSFSGKVLVDIRVSLVCVFT